MRNLVLALSAAVVLGGSALSAAGEAGSCALAAPDREARLSASVAVFDDSMDPAKSWRPIMTNGCPDEAVGLLKEYLVRHGASMSGPEVRQMHFHMGQVLAMFDRNGEAAGFLPAAIDPAPADAAARQWNAYVRGTLAFLTGDSEGIRRAIEAYRAEGQATDRAAVLEGLLKCPNTSYMAASAGQC
jgi:hypothetical protein